MDFIKENIRHEARQYLKYGKQMPVRDARWDSLKAELLNEERHNLETEFFKDCFDHYTTLKVTIQFEDWMEIAKSLYRIDGNTVISIARGPEFEKQWHESCLGNCHKRIMKLIKMKKYDHFVKGYDFAYVPMQKVG